MTDSTPAPLTPPSRRDTWLWAGLLLLLPLIAFQPAIHGSFLWDDNRYAMIGVNTPLRSLQGLANIWLHPSTDPAHLDTFTTVQYYPLTFTLFWLQYHLWGTNPIGYHLVNILLHAASALVLWRLLKFLRLPGAWVAAAIFAVHPIEVESVAWITELKNVLSGLFFLSSLYAYLRFASPDETDSLLPRLPNGAWYTLSALFFTCAVFSKTVTSLMPVVAILLLFWRFRPRLASPRTLLGLLPFLLLGFVLSRQTAWMEINIVGAHGPDWDHTLSQKFLIAGHAFWFYLGKLLWPMNLSFTYLRWNPDTLSWLYPLSAASLLLISTLWLLLGKRYRGLPAAILIYAALLFPALGFFNVYPMRFSFVADHFQYLAGIAILSLIVSLITSRLWRGENAPTAKFAQGLAGIILLACLILTWRQSSIYASPFTLWEDTVAKNPSAWMAHYNLGTELARRAVDSRLAGDAESAAKDSADAITHFQQAVTLRPQHANAYANWASVLLDTGHPEEAVAKANQSLSINPNADEPHMILGQAYVRLNKLSDAQAEFEKAVSIDPSSWQAHYQLGRFLSSQNQLPAAEASFRKSEQLRPNDASIQMALATTLDRQLKVKEALPHALRAVELHPDNPDYLATLGFLWAENGRPREAYAAFNHALEIDPNNTRAFQGAKTLIETVGKMKRAATSRSATTRALTTLPTSRPAR